MSKRCDHSIRLIVGLSKHDLLKHFDVINIDISPSPTFIKSVPTLFHNGKIISGEPLFDYMNDFAKKITQVNEKAAVKESADEMEAWCPDGGCSIGYSEISESDDNFKDSFHKEFGGGYEPIDLDARVPTMLDNEDSGQDKKEDDFNKKYEEFMNSRK